MKLRLNISTCPNDTFMFDALLHDKIDTKGYQFELCMADIEQLNDYVEEASVDISKLSYARYPSISQNYEILGSGSAIGRGNGPLLVSKHKIYPDELCDCTIAIPGQRTTANLLLQRIFPNIKSKREYLFSDVSSAVLDGEVDCGVLIHEERFLYAQKGLKLVADLGDEWERLTGKMIPLGAIVIKRNLPYQTKKDIEILIRKSVEFAFANRQSSYGFVKQHARELDDDVIDKHISMFVNEYSLDIKQEGRDSVKELFKGFDNLNNIFLD